MNDIIVDSLAHGQAMYRAGLKHAIATLEIDPENALEILKEKLVKEEAEWNQ